MGPLTDVGFGLAILLVVAYAVYRLVKWAITKEVPVAVLEWLITPMLFFFTLFGAGALWVTAIMSLTEALSSYSREETPFYLVAATLCTALCSFQFYARKRLTAIRRERYKREDWWSKMMLDDYGEWWQFWKG